MVFRRQHEEVYQENEKLRALVEQMREALLDIRDYEETTPQDPADVYEHFQAVARAALAAVPVRNEDALSDYGLVASLHIPPADCTNNCGSGPCDCSGVYRVVAYSKESVDAVVAEGDTQLSDADWIYHAEAVTGGLCVGPCEKEKAALARVRELEAVRDGLEDVARAAITWAPGNAKIALAQRLTDVLAAVSPEERGATCDNCDGKDTACPVCEGTGRVGCRCVYPDKCFCYAPEYDSPSAPAAGAEGDSQ